MTEEEVKSANRQFYDAVAGRYEALDGRRSPTLAAWLRENLVRLRRRAPGGRLLDLGAGAGFVTRCAEGIFSERVAVDLSPKVLAVGRQAFDAGAMADVEMLPFGPRSFDVVVCFAVLHHLYDVKRLAAEAARVIVPHGIFYADHDLDLAFARRFRWPLSVYRRWRRPMRRFQEMCPQITPDVYRLAEWHSEGVDAAHVARCLEQAGFAVKMRFHWYGLTPITDRLFHRRSLPRGWAPLASIVAVRKRTV